MYDDDTDPYALIEGILNTEDHDIDPEMWLS